MGIISVVLFSRLKYLGVRSLQGEGEKGFLSVLTVAASTGRRLLPGHERRGKIENALDFTGCSVVVSASGSVVAAASDSHLRGIC